MCFRDFVEILFQAYLQDKNYLQTLRDKIQTDSFSKDSIFDPAFENWKSIDPRRVDQGELPRWKYHPHPLDPESGVYVYENKNRAQENWSVIKDCINKRRRNDKNPKS